MKTLPLFIIHLLAITLLSGWELSRENASPTEKATQWYLQALDDVTEALQELRAAAQAQDVELNKQYRLARNQYKDAEFMLYYLNPVEVNTHINGAPLPQLAPDADNLSVLQPSGWQVIDELIAGPKGPDEFAAISTECDGLLVRMQQLRGFQQHLTLSDRHLFEAVREGIIYISTLSITGFDTPGTASGLEDASIALKRIQWGFNLYSQRLEELDFQGLHRANEIFERGIAWLEHADFDNFDRFTFTRDVLNPLSTWLLEAQSVLHIEYRDEVEALPMAVNFRSPHLYAEDFLNDDFFKPRVKTERESAIKELGRTLFFDPILSANNERACASCHAPELAFSEDRPTSLAFDEKSALNRNAMTLVNSVYSEHFFYDLRAGNLFTQFEHVLISEGEFNSSYPEVTEKLNNCPDYQALFNDAFKLNGRGVRKEHVNKALATYVASLHSFNSPFDQMIRNERPSDNSVVQGFNLFLGKAQCGTCHFPPTFAGLRPPHFNDSESEVLGVPMNEDLEHPVPDEDPGRMASGRPRDRVNFYHQSFKTVTVRNSEISGPYFHNGSFSSLEQVIEFYQKGGGAGLGLDVPHQTLPFDSLELSTKEIQSIISFLHALTDIEGLPGAPDDLPNCAGEDLSDRKVGGQY